MNIEEGFKADIGFVRPRRDAALTSTGASFLQPEWLRARRIRQLRAARPRVDYFFDAARRSRPPARRTSPPGDVDAARAVSRCTLEPRTETITSPFRIRSVVAIPADVTTRTRAPVRGPDRPQPRAVALGPHHPRRLLARRASERADHVFYRPTTLLRRRPAGDQRRRSTSGGLFVTTLVNWSRRATR